MSFVSSALILAASTSDEGVSIGFYVILFALLGLVVIVMRRFFAGRAKTSVDGVTGDAPDALAIRIAPAPPFPDDVARLRALVGDASPEPRITRYTVPVVTVDSDALVVRDKKIGHIVSVPLTDIASVKARVTPIKPKGTIVTRKYPALVLTVTRNGTDLPVALTPVVGAYDKIAVSDAEALAAELTARLGASRE